MIRAILRHVRMAMKRPFGHARFTRTQADNILLSITLDGADGHGEAAPRSYVTGETVDSVLEVLASANPERLAQQVALSSFEDAVASIEALDLPRTLRASPVRPQAAACAVELALLDAVGKRFGRALSELPAVLNLPEALRQAQGVFVPVTRVLDSTLTPGDLSQPGVRFHHVKIKVGQGLEEDVTRVRAVRELMGRSVPISVDANMAWSLAQARAAVEAFQPYGIAWFEEPMAPRDWKALRILRHETGARLMLDESLCTREDAEAALSEQACDLFNLRISKCGGLMPCLRLAELAHRAGLGFQLGAQVGEMGPLWAAGRRFAASVRGFSAYEAGQADHFFSEQVVSPPHQVDRIQYLATDLPGDGLGVTPTPALDRFTVAAWSWDGERFRKHASMEELQA